MSIDRLVVRGAREHNLKNVSIDLPRNALIVFTGLSGSGKSSLAFDTIFAEGQRRYVESLSAYARQFLGQMDKPDVDFIEGLSIKNLQTEIQDLRLEQLPKFTIIYVCSSLELVGPIVQAAERQLQNRHHKILLTRYLRCRSKQNS